MLSFIIWLFYFLFFKPNLPCTCVFSGFLQIFSAPPSNSTHSVGTFLDAIFLSKGSNLWKTELRFERKCQHFFLGPGRYLAWKIEGKAVKLLKTTFTHRSTSYLCYDVQILYIKDSCIMPPLRIWKCVPRIITGARHHVGKAMNKIANKKFEKCNKDDYCRLPYASKVQTQKE